MDLNEIWYDKNSLDKSLDTSYPDLSYEYILSRFYLPYQIQLGEVWGWLKIKIFKKLELSCVCLFEIIILCAIEITATFININSSLFMCRREML